MENLQVGDRVNIIDTNNYKSSYSEDKYPSEAIIFKIYDDFCYWVVSVNSHKVYELYRDQIEK